MIQSDRGNLAHGWRPFLVILRKTPGWHIDAVRGQSTPSLDHLVGAGEQRRRNFEAEGLGGPQIDHQLELRGLLHGQVGRLLAFEDAAAIDADLPVAIDETAAVACKTAGCWKLLTRVDRRQRMISRKLGKLAAAAIEKCVGANQKA